MCERIHVRARSCRRRSGERLRVRSVDIHASVYGARHTRLRVRSVDIQVYMYVGGGRVQLPRRVLHRRRSVLRRLGGRSPPAARVAGPLLVQPRHVGPRGLG